MEKIFVEGMSVFAPRVGAPDFVKANISIKPTALINFMKEHKEYISDKGYFSVDLMKSKTGGLYLSLNTYKPNTEVRSKEPEAGKVYRSSLEEVVDYPISPEDLPAF